MNTVDEPRKYLWWAFGVLAIISLIAVVIDKGTFLIGIDEILISITRPLLAIQAISTFLIVGDYNADVSRIEIWGRNGNKPDALEKIKKPFSSTAMVAAGIIGGLLLNIVFFASINYIFLSVKDTPTAVPGFFDENSTSIALIIMFLSLLAIQTFFRRKSRYIKDVMKKYEDGQAGDL